MNLRSVVDTIPEFPNSEVTFYRRGGTFTLDEAYPSRQQSVTTDDNGAYSIDLWPNAEGLSATTYLAVYPGKDTFTFVLAPGDDPITAAELREQEDWAGVPPTPTSIAVERARYANQDNSALGAELIGYSGRTVAEKLGDTLHVADYGAYGDGTTDDAAALNTVAALAATLGKRLTSDGSRHHLIKSTVTIPDGIAGVDWGWALITQHPDIDNAPGIDITGSNLTFTNFRIVGDMTEVPAGSGPYGGDGLFNDSLYGTQRRRAIRVLGDNVIIRVFDIADAVVGIEHCAISDGSGTAVSRPHGGLVEHGRLTNSVVRAGVDGWNGACVGLYARGVDGLTWGDGLVIDGFGESVSSGPLNVGTVADPVFLDCDNMTMRAIRASNPDDNCIYVGGTDMLIESPICSGYNQSAVKALVTRTRIVGVRAQPSAGSGGVIILPNRIRPVLGTTTLSGAHLAGATTITLAAGGRVAAGIDRSSWIDVYLTTLAPQKVRVVDYDDGLNTLLINRALLENTSSGRPVRHLSVWGGEDVTVDGAVIQGVTNIGVGTYSTRFEGMPAFVRNPRYTNCNVEFTAGNAKYPFYHAAPAMSDGITYDNLMTNGHATGVFINADTTFTPSTNTTDAYDTGDTVLEILGANGLLAGEPIEIELLAEPATQITTISSIVGTTLTIPAPGLVGPVPAGALIRRVGGLTTLTADAIAGATVLTVGDPTSVTTDIGDIITIRDSLGVDETRTVTEIILPFSIRIGTGLTNAASAGAQVTRSGAVPINVLLTATAAIGATSLTVTAAQGFQPGDQLAVGDDNDQLEFVTVQSTSGTDTVNIKPALTAQATAGNTVMLVDAMHLNTTITNVNAEGATTTGLRLTNTYQAKLTNVNGKHARYVGADLVNCIRTRIVDSVFGSSDPAQPQNLGVRESGVSKDTKFLGSSTDGAGQSYSAMSATTSYFTASKGSFALGNIAPASAIKLNVYHAVTDPTAGQYGIQAQVIGTFTTNFALAMRGIVGDLSVSPAAGTTFSNSPSGGRGVQGISRNIGAGTATFLTGVQGQVINSGAGTITNGAAFHAAGPTNSGGGTFTTAYGFYASKQTGVAGTGFAFYAVDASDPSYFAGRIGIGTTNPTARLHLTAGTATASTAPLKLNSGTAMTTAEAGALEYSSGRLTFTESDAVRRFIVQALASTKTTAAAPYTNDGYITVRINGSDIKLMTTA